MYLVGKKRIGYKHCIKRNNSIYLTNPDHYRQVVVTDKLLLQTGLTVSVILLHCLITTTFCFVLLEKNALFKILGKTEHVEVLE